MYRKHFALTRFPFEGELQPDALFAATAMAEAEARLKHLLELRAIGLITGEAGSGKTTICRKVASSLHPSLYRLFYVPLSTGSVMDMYHCLAWELGLPGAHNRAAAFCQIRTEVTRLTREAKQRVVVIIDEAHHLRNEVLEDLRLLTNYEMDSENRLGLILLGLTELRRRLARDEHVLDLGCGDGALTAYLAELLPYGDVVGVDASQGMIDEALLKVGKNLSFRRLDINELDFVEEFDLIFSNATLHWIKDHQHLFRTVHKALRTSGRLRFNFAGDGNCSHFFAVARQAMELDEFHSFFEDFEWPWYMPPVDEYKALAESSGLHDVQVWGENADRFFPNTEAMVRWVDQPSLVPFLALIADPAKTLFRDVVVNKMIEETQQEDG